jgi:hypothetical protein
MIIYEFLSRVKAILGSLFIDSPTPERPLLIFMTSRPTVSRTSLGAELTHKSKVTSLIGE